jgi:hypothetical protein
MLLEEEKTRTKICSTMLTAKVRTRVAQEKCYGTQASSHRGYSKTGTPREGRSRLEELVSCACFKPLRLTKQIAVWQGRLSTCCHNMNEVSNLCMLEQTVSWTDRRMHEAITGNIMSYFVKLDRLSMLQLFRCFHCCQSLDSLSCSNWVVI